MPWIAPFLKECGNVGEIDRSLVIKSNDKIMCVRVRDLPGSIPFKGLGLAGEVDGQLSDYLSNDPGQIAQEVHSMLSFEGNLRATEGKIIANEDSGSDAKSAGARLVV